MQKSWPKSKEELEERRINRELLTDHVRKRFDFSRSDQNRRVPEPPIQKPYSPDDVIVDLPDMKDWTGYCEKGLCDALASRRSRRQFKEEPLDLEELSFLLWATQGIRENGTHHFRTVPSAGARHSFETYLAIGEVKGLKSGLYRFLPIEHSLLQIKLDEEISEKVAAASFGQKFIGSSSAVFIWTSIPYRMEWRYGPAAHRVIAFDIGHVCQNLYLAVEGIDAGTCAIGAYDQERMDKLIGVDGEEEFVLYLAPVGKI